MSVYHVHDTYHGHDNNFTKNHHIWVWLSPHSPGQNLRCFSAVQIGQKSICPIGGFRGASRPPGAELAQDRFGTVFALSASLVPDCAVKLAWA